MTGADTPIVQGNTSRYGLIIGSPKVATVWLSFVGPAVVGQGIPLRPGTAPLVLIGWDIGPCLTDEIRGISEGVAEKIGVIDLRD